MKSKMRSPHVLPAVVLAAAMLVSLPAPAAEPTAIVEDVTSDGPGIGLFEYLEPGRVLKLSGGEKVVLGYLRSCVRETITGGTVTIGTDKSSVIGGDLKSEKVECDGGAMELTTAEAGKSAVMVFRKPPGTRPKAPAPQLTLYGASPVITLGADSSTVRFSRLDKPGQQINVLVEGRRADLADRNIALAPGGLYRAEAGGKTLTVRVDPAAKAGPGPVVGRLIRF